MRARVSDALARFVLALVCCDWTLHLRGTIDGESVQVEALFGEGRYFRAEETMHLPEGNRGPNVVACLCPADECAEGNIGGLEIIVVLPALRDPLREARVLNVLSVVLRTPLVIAVLVVRSQVKRLEGAC